MANISVNTKEFQTKIEQKLSKLDRRTTVNKKAVILMDSWIQKNFQSQGDLAYPGKGWRPLNPKTIERRRQGPKIDREPMILQDTGQLRSRWKHFWSQRKAHIQSGVEYGLYHEEGRGHLPERKILPTKEQIMPVLMKLYGKWVNTNLK